jgi:hypothetical protein
MYNLCTSADHLACPTLLSKTCGSHHAKDMSCNACRQSSQGKVVSSTLGPIWRPCSKKLGIAKLLDRMHRRFPFLPGDWICGCGNHCFARHSVCPLCSARRRRRSRSPPVRSRMALLPRLIRAPRIPDEIVECMSEEDSAEEILKLLSISLMSTTYLALDYPSEKPEWISHYSDTCHKHAIMQLDRILGLLGKCTCVCIWTNVSMYAWIHVCICMALYERVYVCMYVCIYVCMYVCMYACMYACMYVCMYVCMHVCMYVCMYVNVCTCVCTDVRMYLRTYIQYVCLCVRVHA